MTRIFIVEPLRDQAKQDMLSRHGEIVALSQVVPIQPPPVWNTFETSKWMQDSIAEVGGFNYETDYLALVGNYLALAQLTATLVAFSPTPYKIRCLSFYQAKGKRDEFCHVVLEEYLGD